MNVEKRGAISFWWLLIALYLSLLPMGYSFFLPLLNFRVFDYFISELILCLDCLLFLLGGWGGLCVYWEDGGLLFLCVTCA